MDFLPDQRFDCSQCGRCCRGWRIRVDQDTVSRLQQAGHQSKLEVQEGRHFLQRHPGGACTFLSPENRCGLHDLGKPLGCQQFPFRLVRTPAGVHVGVSFVCPAVQSNQGRPLSAHLEQCLEFAQALPMLGEHIRLHHQRPMSWADYLELEKFLLQTVEPEATEEILCQAAWACCKQLQRSQDQPLTQLLNLSQEACSPPQEPFVLAHHHLVAYWLSRLEGIVNGPLLTNCKVSYPRFGGIQIRFLELMRQPLAFPELMLRYVKAVIFRKALLARSNLLENLAVLYLVPRLVTIWTHLSSLEQGRESPLMDDFWKAVDFCECKLVTHPNQVQEGYSHSGQALLDWVK